MINITKYNNKWRIEIDLEKWEFEDLRTCMDELENLCEIKDKYGNIKKYEEKKK